MSDGPICYALLVSISSTCVLGQNPPVSAFCIARRWQMQVMLSVKFKSHVGPCVWCRRIATSRSENRSQSPFATGVHKRGPRSHLTEAVSSFLCPFSWGMSRWLAAVPPSAVCRRICIEPGVVVWGLEAALGGYTCRPESASRLGAVTVLQQLAHRTPVNAYNYRIMLGNKKAANTLTVSCCFTCDSPQGSEAAERRRQSSGKGSLTRCVEFHVWR